MPPQTAIHDFTSEGSTPPTPRLASADTYYISHISGGTGGAGGDGGKEGGGGGLGEGPTFQAATMHVVIQNQSIEDREIIKWASPLNFFPRQEDIFQAREPETGEWLLQESQYKKWKAGKIHALWCRGMPGAGKTVLASIVVHHLRTNLGHEKNRAAVLYLDHKATTETHSPTNLLAAIWRQLVVEEPISPVVRGMYKKHYAQGTRPSLKETYSMLYSTVSESFCPFIIVDALDEYPQEERDILLCHLWKLGPTVRLMFTSRPHISIDHVIPELESLHVRALEDDVRKYVSGQIERSSRLFKHINKSCTLRELIEEQIVKRSDGMFLLAKLHINSLMCKQNVAAVRDALTNLSTNMDDAYRDIVDRINQQCEEDRDLALRTLSWIVNARTALQPSRLREALAVKPDITALDPDRQTDMDIVLSVCAGLVVIDKEDDKVRLIHYTTQIYFQLAHVQTALFPHAQSEITKTCFTYMSLTFQKFPNLLRHESLLFTYNQFLHYTVEYCLVHARGDPETNIPEVILSFLSNCSVWWRLWNWKHGGRQSAPDKLRIAIVFDLEVIVRHIIKEVGVGVLLQEAVASGAVNMVHILVQNGFDFEKDGGALQEAASRGHEVIVGILLSHNKNAQCPECRAPQGKGSIQPSGNFNVTEGHLCSALRTAVRKGFEGVTKLLLDHGANVNAEARKFGSLVKTALYEGHPQTAKLLMQHGADIDVGGHYGSVLHIAVQCGFEEIVQQLLERGVNINEAAGEFGSLLQVALQEGHTGVAQLLIEYGANVGGLYSSALRVACRQGHEALVKLLLKHGANVNTKDGKFGGLLQAALWEGHTGTAQVLIEHGADVNALGGHYGRALYIAAQSGFEEIIQLLLQHGADINEAAGEFGSPLQVALQEGHTGVAQLLVEYGANVGGLYSSALRVACRQGHEALVKLLLNHGADANTKDGEFGSLLQVALWEGHTGTAQVLIEHGADVNASGGYYGHALYIAVQNGFEEIIQLLIEHEADMNRGAPGFGSLLQVALLEGHPGAAQLLVQHGVNINLTGTHGSALQVASWLGHQHIVKLLLEHGANINIGGGMHGSALLAASEAGHEAIVKLLLESGADINAKGGMYDSALQAASEKGHETVVKLLLQHSAHINAAFGL